MQFFSLFQKGNRMLLVLKVDDSGVGNFSQYKERREKLFFHFKIEVNEHFSQMVAMRLRRTSNLYRAIRILLRQYNSNLWE